MQNNTLQISGIEADGTRTTLSIATDADADADDCVSVPLSYGEIANLILDLLSRLALMQGYTPAEFEHCQEFCFTSDHSSEQRVRLDIYFNFF